MRLRRKHHLDEDAVIDLTDGADAWWAAADDLVTVAPTYQRDAAPPPPPPAPDPWAPETVYSWGRNGPHDPLNEVEPHRILGLEYGATWEEIEQARRRLAKAHHPDLGTGTNPHEVDLRERRMRAINLAYDSLRRK